MHMRGIAIAIPKNFLFIPLGLFLLVLAGCGSTTNATTVSPNATATACAQTTRPTSSIKTATGTLQSINGSTLAVTGLQGENVSVTYSSTTRFVQESNIVATDLKEGTQVIVAVAKNGGSYSATSITVVTITNGNGFPGVNGFPRGNGTPGANRGGNNPCFSGRRGQSGTPGTNGARGLIGTVGQLSGQTLSITDTAGTSYTVTITPQTKIMETKTVTSAALKVGQALAVTGTVDSKGTLNARQVTILLSLPTPKGTPPPSQ